MTVVQHGAESVTRVVDRFEAEDLGAPFKVFLNHSVTVTFDETTGDVISYKIPDLDGLLRSIVITRILHHRKLSGADIKFVRKVLGLKQKELASKIEITAEHLSRCETGPLVMSPSSEKLLRIFSFKTAFRLHNKKSCDAKAKLEDALDQLFDAIKPVPVFDVNEELELYFHRSRRRKDKSGKDEIDDGQWDGEPEVRAA